MADEALLKERLARAAEVAAPAPRLDRVTDRARVLRRRRAAGAGVVALVLAAAIALPLSKLAGLRDDADLGATDDHVGAIGFESADGWSMAASDPASPEWPPSVWVTNGPFAAADLRNAHEEGGVLRFDVGPEATVEQLPADGILIVADVVYVSRNPLPTNDSFPPAELPLRLPASPPETQWEGVTRDHSLHSIVGEVNGRWVSVRIEYGRPSPDQAMLLEAQRELERLFVEPAPAAIENIDQFGISMVVPEGWDGRLFAWTSGPPTLELSTVPLAQPSGDPAIPNRDRLGTQDVSVILAENDVVGLGFEPTELPIEIREQDRCDGCEVLDDGTSPPESHTLFHRSFEIAGRSFDLYVEFGSSPPPAAMWDAVDDALAGIEIAGADRPAPPDEGPTVLVPEGWFVQENPLPALIDPRIVVAVGSWDFPRPALVACGEQPALRAMPRDGAFFWIVEYPFTGTPEDAGLEGGTPWPSTFSLDLPSRPSDGECAAGAVGSVRDYRFERPDRFVQIHVGLGPDASAATRHDVEVAVSSLLA
jgi:hypothetical protein